MTSAINKMTIFIHGRLLDAVAMPAGPTSNLQARLMPPVMEPRRSALSVLPGGRALVVPFLIARLPGRTMPYQWSEQPPEMGYLRSYACFTNSFWCYVNLESVLFRRAGVWGTSEYPPPPHEEVIYKINYEYMNELIVASIKILVKFLFSWGTSPLQRQSQVWRNGEGDATYLWYDEVTLHSN